MIGHSSGPAYCREGPHFLMGAYGPLLQQPIFRALLWPLPIPTGGVSGHKLLKWLIMGRVAS
jgi:hypothetical protein